MIKFREYYLLAEEAPVFNTQEILETLYKAIFTSHKDALSHNSPLTKDATESIVAYELPKLYGNSFNILKKPLLTTIVDEIQRIVDQNIKDPFIAYNNLHQLELADKIDYNLKTGEAPRTPSHRELRNKFFPRELKKKKK